MFGGLLLLTYLVIVAFFPGISSAKVLLAMPGGLAGTFWMILCGVRLLGFARKTGA